LFGGQGRRDGRWKRVGADDLARKIVAASGRAEAEGVFGFRGCSSFNRLEGDWGEAPGSRQGEESHANRGLTDAGICADKEDASERRRRRAGVQGSGRRGREGGQGLGCGLGNSGGGGVHEVVDLVGSDREWRHEDHHGTERAQDDPVASNDAADTCPNGLFRGVGAGARVSELDTNH
jgi:hypothetical protein